MPEPLPDLDRIWAIATRVMLSLVLVVAAGQPVWREGGDTVVLWKLGSASGLSLSDAPGEIALGGFIVGWTLATLIAVALTLVVPPSMVGRRARTLLGGLLGCFAAGHLVLFAVAGRPDSPAEVDIGNYLLVIASAAVLCVLWLSSRRRELSSTVPDEPRR